MSRRKKAVPRYERQLFLIPTRIPGAFSPPLRIYPLHCEPQLVIKVDRSSGARKPSQLDCWSAIRFEVSATIFSARVMYKFIHIYTIRRVHIESVWDTCAQCIISPHGIASNKRWRLKLNLLAVSPRWWEWE